MYCTNCGKEVKDDYKYCKNCGNSIEDIEKDEKKHMKEEKQEEVEEKHLGMRYFKFFSKVYLTIIMIISILGMVNYKNIEEWNIYIFYNLILDIMLYIVIPFKLIEELPKRTSLSYILVLAFLILDYIYKVISVSIITYTNNQDTTLLTYILITIIMYGIWFIPNIIYFLKRRNMFKN